MRSLLAILVVCAAACGGDDDDDDDIGPDTISISGTLSADVIGSGTKATSGGGGGGIDTVVGIPALNGDLETELLTQIVTADVEGDGSFSIELSTDKNWVLLLDDSTQSQVKERIVGYVTVGGGDDSMLLFPTTGATDSVDLGTLEAGDGSEATSGADLEEIAESFDFTLDDLLAIAKSDDAYLHLINAYLNWEPSTGIYWFPTNNLDFAAPLANLESAEAGDYAYLGSKVSLSTNDPAMISGWDGFCDSSVDYVAVVPGAQTVTLSSGLKLGSFRNTDVADTGGGQCHGDSMGASQYTDNIIYYFPGEDFIFVPQTGFWRFWNGTEWAAWFSLFMDQAVVTAVGEIILPVPVPALTIGGDGSITSVEVTWWSFDVDAGEYVQYPDIDALSTIVYSSVVTIADASGSESINADGAGTTFEVEQTWMVSDIETFKVFYEVFGQLVGFTWLEGYWCGDDEIQGEQCDRSQFGAATCESLGLGAGDLSCSAFCERVYDDCADAVTGPWTQVGNLNVIRSGAVSARLDDGSVVNIGGTDGVGGAMLASAEVYDPTTRAWTVTAGSMTDARVLHTATVLADGRVLVVGGGESPDYLASAELYDPATGLFTPTGSLAAARIYHTATLLDDGRVLVTGGTTPTSGLVDATEIYDPTTGLFTPGPTMAHARYRHTATKLPSGEVFVFGGGLNSLFPSTTSGELFNPTTGLFEPTVGEPRVWHSDHTAVYVPDTNEVLLVGGRASIPQVNGSAQSWEVDRYLVGSKTYAFGTRATGALVSGVLVDSGHALILEATKTWAYYPAAVLNRSLPNHTSIAVGNHGIVSLEDGDILLITSRFTWLFEVQ